MTSKDIFLNNLRELEPGSKVEYPMYLCEPSDENRPHVTNFNSDFKFYGIYRRSKTNWGLPRVDIWFRVPGCKHIFWGRHSGHFTQICHVRKLKRTTQ